MCRQGDSPPFRREYYPREGQQLPPLPRILGIAEYALPELVGQMFDRTILAGDALRPIADAWCRFALDGLYRVGRVVRPLRDAAERSRAAARVAAALDGDSEDRLTTSFVSSTDSDAGSGSSDSDSEP